MDGWFDIPMRRPWGAASRTVVTPMPSRAVVVMRVYSFIHFNHSFVPHCLHFLTFLIRRWSEKCRLSDIVCVWIFEVFIAISRKKAVFLNGGMDKTLIFKSNMSPISSLRRRSSCYNIQRAEERDRRKSAKFECLLIFILYRGLYTVNDSFAFIVLNLC